MWYDCHMDNLKMCFATVSVAVAMNATAVLTVTEVMGTLANTDTPKMKKRAC